MKAGINPLRTAICVKKESVTKNIDFFHKVLFPCQEHGVLGCADAIHNSPHIVVFEP